MKHQDSRQLSRDYIEIDATQMEALQKEKSTLIIDVRERHEVPVIGNEIFTQVPMSEFITFLETDIQAENIVLLCQHGIRSVQQQSAEKSFLTTHWSLFLRLTYLEDILFS